MNTAGRFMEGWYFKVCFEPPMRKSEARSNLLRLHVA